MNTLEQIPPVRKEILVEAPQARVFRVFTRDMNRWWPREHHIGAAPLERVVIEDHIGGRWYSIHTDGSETDTGRVLEWDPPRRIVLSWQINADWKFDPGLVTEVEVTFTPETPTTTRVNLEHRNMARFGVKAMDVRNSVDSPNGWGWLLSLMAEEAQRTTD